ADPSSPEPQKASIPLSPQTISQDSAPKPPHLSPPHNISKTTSLPSAPPNDYKTANRFPAPESFSRENGRLAKIPPCRMPPGRPLARSSAADSTPPSRHRPASAAGASPAAPINPA